MAICFAEYDAPTAEEVEEVKQYVKDCFQSQEGCPGSSGIRNSAIRLSNPTAKSKLAHNMGGLKMGAGQNTNTNFHCFVV